MESDHTPAQSVPSEPEAAPQQEATLPPQEATLPQQEAAPGDGREQAHAGGFLIVGLGASAGGIGALTRFFDNLPATSGMAFVVIVHLPPEHESNLAALLQQHTAMGVTQVTGVVPITPNHVYVIPPAKYLTMRDSMIQLADPPEQSRNRRAPIDHFFRTLAEAAGTRAAGVVLSGSGADGTIGLPRIKEMGGVTLVQDPDEAEYGEMPRSAIATGLADFVLPVAEMPEQLLNYWENANRITLPVEEEPARFAQGEQLGEILAFLRARTGHNFADYKRSTVMRRIERRMQVNDMPSLGQYLTFLRRHAVEVQALLRDLLISVTNFFRDRAAWDALETEVIPRLFQGRDPQEPVRVWVAGCATGEEAYSVAILLQEYARTLDQPPPCQIFATDLDEQAIAIAREGSYPETIALDVNADRLRHFFTADTGRYHVRKEIRDMILFAVHDVLKDPPFSRLDLVTCRNLLIYLNKDAQEQVLSVFQFALKPDAILFLGMSESTDGVPQFYTAVDKKHRIFARRTLPRSVAPIPSLPITRPDRTPPLAVPAIAERSATAGELHSGLLERYAPPSVVVNETYDVVHLSQRAGRYLQFAGGDPTYNLLRVIHPELRLDLSTALYMALQKGRANETRRIPVHLDGAERLVRVTVHPIADPAALRGYGLVIFDEIEETPDGGHERAAANEIAPMTRQLEEEVQLLRDQLRLAGEQHETTVEELRASNEELQAMNEELRSATEELETSKEELQAVNEELLTVNDELKGKVDEVGRVNSDLQNLMVSTDIGTVFLDRELRVKRYTPQMQRLFNIIPTDLNRPLAHVTHKLNYDGLAEDAQQVLQKLRVIEREIQSSNGEWYMVRLLPYRTVDDKIAGVVMTFVDVTERARAAKEREALIGQLAAQQARFEAVVQQMPAGLIIAEAPSGRVIYHNTEMERIWKIVGVPIPISVADDATHYKSYHHDGTLLPPSEWPLARAISHGETVGGDEIRLVLPDGRQCTVLIAAAPIRDQDGQIVSGAMSWLDISERKEMEEELRAANEQMEQRVDARTAELGTANAALQSEIAVRRAGDQARGDLLRLLVSSQEDEQRRISRELHDQLGQSLTGLKFILEALTRSATAPQSESLHEAMGIVDDLTTRVSTLSLDLRPPALDDLGLVPALLSLITRFTGQTGIQVDFQHSGLDARLHPEIETTVFRLVQEALTNVARHAETRQARVLVVADGDVTVQIEDQGRGFDPDVTAARHTRGLLGMKERALLIGGTLTLESAPGRGTRVIAQLPKEPTTPAV